MAGAFCLWVLFLVLVGMDITGKVHCFFEQSGTFKQEFIKLGIPAEDYDIQDNFGQTDHVVDLFAEIESAYAGRPSVFDTVGGGDLIIAFFPCIYFTGLSAANMSWTAKNYRKKSLDEATALILKRTQDRQRFLEVVIKMFHVVRSRGLRLIMENPWSMQCYLKFGFLMAPTLVDTNRMLRGDYYVKPTAYWFVGCEPTHLFTPQEDKRKRSIVKDRPSGKAGVCSEERSMISPDYARNFICDFVLGRQQEMTLTSLF